VDPSNLDTTITSKLQLVDLAGSEKTIASSQTMAKESIDINKSLFVLRKVINRLSELTQKTSSDDPKKKNTVALNHVPYRDSKLTSLLKHSLGGNSYCLMIACISPSERYLDGPSGGVSGSGETVSTLQYATRAACIQNQPIKNVDPKIKIIYQLQFKVERLQVELKHSNDHIAFLTQQMKNS
jgi:kinesin family protein 4/21/27